MARRETRRCSAVERLDGEGKLRCAGVCEVRMWFDEDDTVGLEHTEAR